MGETKETLNGTVYETEDVLAILNATMAALRAQTAYHASTVGSLKIRYLNQPKVVKSYGKPDAEYSCSATLPHWGDMCMEVALLRPTKLKMSPLKMLAQAADDYDAEDEGVYFYAPTEFVISVAEAISATLRRTRRGSSDLPKEVRASIAAGDLCLRVNKSAKGAKAYTLRRLRDQVEGALGSLKSIRSKLADARCEVARLENKLPAAQARLAKLEKRLSKHEKP